MLDRRELETVTASVDLASALLQGQGLRPTRTGGHLVVEQAALAQFSGSMGALLRPVPRMRSTRNDTEYPDADTQIEPEVVLADLDKARDIVQACRRVLPLLTVFQR